jgi:hypothetical protein
MSDAAIAQAARARQALELFTDHLDRIKQQSLEGMLRAKGEDRDDLLSLARACEALKKRLSDDVAAGLMAEYRADLDDQAGQ